MQYLAVGKHTFIRLTWKIWGVFQNYGDSRNYMFHAQKYKSYQGNYGVL